MSTTETVAIGKGFEVIVDSDIWKKRRLWDWKWYPLVNKQAGRVYAVSACCTEIVYMHRLLIGAVKGQVVDHKNGNSLDNRLCNLRIVTAQQNRANSRKDKDNQSGYKGVTRSGRNWMAQITVGGIKHYLGCFAHKVRAAKAYDRAALRFHGACAGLNFERLRSIYRV